MRITTTGTRAGLVLAALMITSTGCSTDDPAVAEAPVADVQATEDEQDPVGADDSDDGDDAASSGAIPRLGKTTDCYNALPMTYC